MTRKQEKELTDALLATYQQVGAEVHYWAIRFLQSLRKNGGLVTAQRAAQLDAQARCGVRGLSWRRT